MFFQRPEEGIVSPAAIVTVDYELLSMDAGSSRNCTCS